MLPITTGVIPFGAVMGTVCAEAKLTLFQTMSMNILVFAGAAQLAAVDLMTKHAAIIVVVLTGLIINIRFLLYSAALSPVLKNSKFFTKLVSAYFLTDQSYAVMLGDQHRPKTNAETVEFYLGSCVCMMISWQLSVIAGFIFGNFAPAEWALDYAVPLSFVALVIPTLKNSKYVMVAAFSSIVSLGLHSLPYKIGLIVTALLAITFAAAITKRRGAHD